MKETENGHRETGTNSVGKVVRTALGVVELRDWFAGHAMQSMLHSEIGKSGWATVHGVAADAYKVADAMLKAREVKP